MKTDHLKIDPALYVVSTPIGNLEDISSRLIKVLSASDYILCEDTRVTLKLLNFINIKKKLVSFNEFNENKKLDTLMNDLKKNKTLSIVSDAGTPAMSDPGQLIISRCHDIGIKVIPVPGPSAITCAMSVSGFLDNFYFCGFLPKKQNEINKFFSQLILIKASLVFFMPARDLNKNSKYFLKFFPNSKFFIGREMTKIYETYIRDEMKNIGKYIESNQKGEMSIVIDNYSNKIISDKINIEDEIKLLLGKMSSKDIAEYLSKKLKINKKVIYQKVIGLND